MVKINGTNNIKDELNTNGNYADFSENIDNLIWTMKAVDYINEENQENFNRVHVLCCNKCDFLTISLNALQQHMLLSHLLSDDDFNNLTIYSCQECKCVSTELKLIQEHIKIFHNILTENQSTPEKLTKQASILMPTLSRNGRKAVVHGKLVKTQLKIRKKILQRKCLKNKVGSLLDIEMENKTGKDNYNCLKQDNIQHYDDRILMSQDVSENDPLDMSINSVTCPFKGAKSEALEGNIYSFSMKPEPIALETFDQSNNMSPLLSNPQTCIELIKLTLHQMLSKTSEPNRLSHIGFNPASFLPGQFQLSPNIVPLLLPTGSHLKNNNMTQSDIESLLTNIQQQNLFKTTSPNTFEQQSCHMIGYQQSPLFSNHKLPSSTDNAPSMTHYNSKPMPDFQNRATTKRSQKKQQAPTKIRNGIPEEVSMFPNPKFESPQSDMNQENLFNRSFLEGAELEPGAEHVTLTKMLDDNDNINLSSKSSPTTPLTNDKPHRQNFTSQQNRILSDWFFTHCDKPYPSTEDTKELSQLSGLTYSQVKKWFANKRARSSLNKKNHKNYCLITPAESTMEDCANNDLASISPSSESNKSYTNHAGESEAIDFTKTNCQDELELNGK